MSDEIESRETALPLGSVLALAIDVWRIHRRAQREIGTPQSVIGACERALETLSIMGFDIRELVGESYDQNMLVQVVHEEGGSENRRISECLSPAVYFEQQLVRRAEVVVRGDAQDENSDS